MQVAEYLFGRAPRNRQPNPCPLTMLFISSTCESRYVCVGSWYIVGVCGDGGGEESFKRIYSSMGVR